MASNRLYRITIEPGQCGGQPCIRDPLERLDGIPTLERGNENPSAILALLVATDEARPGQGWR